MNRSKKHPLKIRAPFVAAALSAILAFGGCAGGSKSGKPDGAGITSNKSARPPAPGKGGGDIWARFESEDADGNIIRGYKDKSGAVKVEPKKFIYAPEEFDRVIALMEDMGEKWKTYYLTRTGKMFGTDSVYFFDNTPDAECGGFIRFEDRKTRNVGLFDMNGKVIIPAEAGYNALGEVRNGMLDALKGAKKEPQDEDDDSDWIGGESLLIDTRNNILIEDFYGRLKKDGINIGGLDFFSVEKSKNPHPDTLRASFPAKGGGYYSFVRYELEFRRWLFGDLLVNLTPQKLISASKDTINWSTSGVSSNGFITDNFEVLKKELLGLLDPGCEYHIFIESRSEDCANAYPEMNVRISRVVNGNHRQNYFYFSRTGSGYKLATVGIQTGEKLKGAH